MTRPFEVHRILAPTDLSASGVPALRYARFLAERFKANLTILYSDPIAYPVEVVGPSICITPQPELESRLRNEVVQYVSSVMGAQPYEVRITTGQPAPAILESAKEHGADLIVVGTHRHGGLQRVLLGSTSDSVLYGSQCPVLTVAGGDSVSEQPATIRKILCPVNFTDVARDSMLAAARLAHVLSAKLVIVHVVEPGEITDAEADGRIRRWIAAELGGDGEYRELVLRGAAAERVLDCAEDIGADLIVVGAQHRLFRNATVIGGTADRLIRFASCPVLVVPRQAVAAAKRRAEAEPAMAGGRA
jgi:nucleotide-binding universal stress UspA family protein